jgi:hypothetical protein
MIVERLYKIESNPDFSFWGWMTPWTSKLPVCESKHRPDLLYVGKRNRLVRIY